MLESLQLCNVALPIPRCLAVKETLLLYPLCQSNIFTLYLARSVNLSVRNDERAIDIAPWQNCAIYCHMALEYFLWIFKTLKCIISYGPVQGEFYLIRDVRGGISFTKTNTRYLWFISRDELSKLLEDEGIEVENELREDTGINNLEGVTIYGKFE